MKIKNKKLVKILLIIQISLEALAIVFVAAHFPMPTMQFVYEIE